jgi:DNA-binding response OmpR family regulator
MCHHHCGTDKAGELRRVTRVLLVEDDEALARGVVTLLRDGGFAVDHVDGGESALETVSLEPYALVILDIGLPDISGFEVLTRLRRAGLKVPVLLLTARDAVQDRVAGLDRGADDYLLKPFDPLELEARVRALIRRGHGDPSPILSVGSMTLDQSSGEVRVNGRAIDLRRREIAVLTSLAKRAGKVVPKERLQAEVFDYDDVVAPNALELYIARVRKKLQPDGPHIRALRGMGYVLEHQ